MKYILCDKATFLNSFDSFSDFDSSLLNTTIKSVNNDDDVKSENDDDEFETYTNKVISNISSKKKKDTTYTTLLQKNIFFEIFHNFFIDFQNNQETFSF